MKNKDVCMNPFQFQTVPNIIAGLGSIQELKNVLLKNYHKALL
jgi:alcohol dehydrogenase